MLISLAVTAEWPNASELHYVTQWVTAVVRSTLTSGKLSFFLFFLFLFLFELEITVFVFFCVFALIKSRYIYIFIYF